ncbi:MAG: glutathione ABC transporter permease [Candidatus Rokubacteria bacterium GWC2_70_16]|nr:MAG: glutathione ABC transporter permease [Candidatus Rokubacteria bacterium GWC2_70_16]
MLGYTVRRLLAAVPTLLAVLTVIFLVIRMVPGDPAVALLGSHASAAAIEALRERLGLNQPLHVQYLQFLRGALRGDLGVSLMSGRPVWEHLWNVLPYTIDLTLASVLIGVALGLPLGIVSALYRNRFLDLATRVLSLLGLSLPAFFTAILLMLAFSIRLGLFPVISEGRLDDPLDRLHHLVLPALSLGLIMMTYVTRATRAAMLEVLGEDYIRTARAKGLSERVVVLYHALRNALISIVTVVGLYLGILIGNSVLTEIVFNRPGLGKLIVGALEERDYNVLQGLMVFYAFLVVVINLITDLAYGLCDPRVKYHADSR